MNIQVLAFITIPLIFAPLIVWMLMDLFPRIIFKFFYLKRKYKHNKLVKQFKKQPQLFNVGDLVKINEEEIRNLPFTSKNRKAWRTLNWEIDDHKEYEQVSMITNVNKDETLEKDVGTGWSNKSPYYYDISFLNTGKSVKDCPQQIFEKVS